MVAKPAPLETFLRSVASRDAADQAAENAPDNTRTSPENDAGESSTAAARRSVILTILHQATGPVSENELALRSELAPDGFRTTVDHLQTSRLIDVTDSGYVLTESGNAAAERERRRLLSL